MSQNYFDIFVNRVGEQASQLYKVVPTNKITREEISNWTEED